MPVTAIAPSFAAFRGSVDRAVFEPGFGLWRRVSQAPLRLWAAAVTLARRGGGAILDEVPAEFFRFPPF
jgi:hypothetical protein